MKSLIIVLLTAMLVLIGFKVTQNSGIKAVHWEAPQHNGFKGSFAPDKQLLPLSLIDLGSYSGPEDITVSQNGDLFFSTSEGYILKFDLRANKLEEWVYTGGYPLGVRFDSAQNLIIADASLGLLRVNPERQITILVNQYDHQALGFVDALDIDAKGIIYFSDASRKYSPRDFDGPKNASETDIFEHGGNGRIYAYDPESRDLKILVDNLHFANGVTLTHDQQALLIVETAMYRVLKYTLHGESKGELSIVIDNLPGFPDNIVKHPEFGYWVGLTAPRSSVLDKLSRWPRIRELLHHLPSNLKPSAEHYGHVIHLDESGQVMTSLQDPSGSYPMTTGATQYNGKLYISSLTASAIGVRTL